MGILFLCCAFYVSTKINPPIWRVNFLAERIGLEPMDQKFRSQISNLLHYHSANAPCVGYYIEFGF